MIFETKFSYTSEKFDTWFEAVNKSFSTEFGNFVNIGQGFPKYVGEYTVTPSREIKVLETANKVLTENVTIVAIPYSQVSNVSGGKTYHIAKEN